MLAVKRYIDVEIPVEKFEREAKLFKSLNHKNIVKLVGYYYGASRSGHKLVQYKEKVLSQNYGSEPEQLLCYEYMPNGSLRNYLIGMTLIIINNYHFSMKEDKSVLVKLTT